MTALLRLPPGPCKCTELRPGLGCMDSLLPVQGWYLLEAMAGGALGHVAAGSGKTLIGFLLPMVVPNCKTAVLLIPPELRVQALHDYTVASQHFRLPNLAGRSAGPFYADRPTIHLLAYSKLSAKSCTAWLEEKKPDLVIADEAQNLSNVDGVRGDRFIRYFMDHPETRLCAHSGSLTVDGLDDYSHLAALGLGFSSPLPLEPSTVAEWASALDPVREGKRPAAPAGKLFKLCENGEHVRSGFRRRLVESLGVISTLDSAISTRLILRKRKPPEMPDAVVAALKQVRAGERPDGEELIEDAEVIATARQVAYGFYYFWRFPHGEPEALIEKWYARRKAWRRAVRIAMESRKPGVDSPQLLAEAADRSDAKAPPEEGPQWYCPDRKPWLDVDPLVQPVPDFEWIDDWMAADAVAWGKENVGIIWYGHTAFGKRVAELGGFTLYEGGTEANRAIAREDGSRTVVASLKAHGTGKNLVQWSKALLANPPSNNGQLEQVLARTHRLGQRADTVTVDFYGHTLEVVEGWVKAVSEAEYKHQTTGAQERVLFAEKVGWQ